LPEERIVRRNDLLGLAAGLGLAIIVGYVNTHTDEIPIVLSCALIATGLLGLALPRAPWRWAVLVALALPVGQAIALVLGLRVPYPNSWSALPVTAVAVVPCLIGAYGRALVRRIDRSLV
jgi:hypothetical protein